MRVDLPRWTGRQAGIDGRVDWSNACDACRSQQLRRRCRRIRSGTSHAPILGRCIAVEPAPAEIADLSVPLGRFVAGREECSTHRTVHRPQYVLEASGRT